MTKNLFKPMTQRHIALQSRLGIVPTKYSLIRSTEIDPMTTLLSVPTVVPPEHIINQAGPAHAPLANINTLAPGSPHSIAAVADVSHYPAASVAQVSHVEAPPSPQVLTHPADGLHSLGHAVHAAPAPPLHGAAPPAIVSSQYHAQDEEGNYSFGYSNPNGAREESGNPYTGVTG